MKDLLQCHLINYSMLLSPCKNYLAISNNFNCIKVVKLSNESQGCLLKISNNHSGNAYHLKTCGQFMLCTSDCYIVAWKWTDIITSTTMTDPDLKCCWKEALPQNSDYFGYLQILSLFVDEPAMIIYVGASDGAIHKLKVLDDGSPYYLSSERNMNTTAVSLCNSKEFSLIAGCTDGSVRFWDNRVPGERIRLETSGSDVARPKVGTCINAVTTDASSPDWVLCGGEPQLALWNVRAGKIGVAFDTGDASSVIFDALLCDQAVLAGGTSSNVYLWDMSGQLNSEMILSSTRTVYSLLHRGRCNNPLMDSSSNDNINDFFVCGWGPSVDLYSSVGYRKSTFLC